MHVEFLRVRQVPLDGWNQPHLIELLCSDGVEVRGEDDDCLQHGMAGP